MHKIIICLQLIIQWLSYCVCVLSIYAFKIGTFHLSSAVELWSYPACSMVQCTQYTFTSFESNYLPLKSLFPAQNANVMFKGLGICTDFWVLECKKTFLKLDTRRYVITPTSIKYYKKCRRVLYLVYTFSDWMISRKLQFAVSSNIRINRNVVSPI
jgi:hypothetical protein